MTVIGAGIEAMMVVVAQFYVAHPAWSQHEITFIVFIFRLIDMDGVEVVEVGTLTVCSP